MKHRTNKAISIFMSALIITAVFTGCNQAGTTPTETPIELTTPTPETTPDIIEPTPEPTLDVALDSEQNETEQSTSGLKTGLGIHTEVSKSTAATKEKNGTAASTSVIASILTDTEGLILKCDLDSTQTTIPISVSGQLEMDKSSIIQSKVLTGTSYGMASVSPISKEWNEQAKSFSDWCIGKTVSEINGMTLRRTDDGGIYPDVPDLATSVTIDIGGFLSAIHAASTSLVDTDMQSAPAKTGLGITSTINSKSIGASTDAGGLLQVDATTAAISLDESGRILSCRFDAAQPKITFDQAGGLTMNPSEAVQSKHSLKEAYGMTNSSSIGKEWYQQADSLSNWVVGKTIDEIRAFGVQALDQGEGISIDDPDLASSVTIAVGDFMVALEKAVENAQ